MKWNSQTLCVCVCVSCLHATVAHTYFPLNSICTYKKSVGKTQICLLWLSLQLQSTCLSQSLQLWDGQNHLAVCYCQFSFNQNTYRNHMEELWKDNDYWELINWYKSEGGRVHTMAQDLDELSLPAYAHASSSFLCINMRNMNDEIACNNELLPHIHQTPC